jgi:ubiquinone/menaquinone biosynthesis C-methylase UbiE
MSHDPHQAFFDELAAEWDLNFTAEDLERLEFIVNHLGVKPGMNILDLGCGTGVLFDMLRRRVGQEGTVTGVDFSIEMARKAHRNFPFPNVNVVDADASALPFFDSTFDMGISFASFPHFTHQQTALDEVDRVLKPRAMFYIIHLISSRELSEIHEQIGGVLEKDKLPAADKMRAMFDASNFSEVQIDDHPGLYLASAVNAKTK